MGAEDGFPAGFISGFRHSGIMHSLPARIAASQRTVGTPGYLIPFSNELD
ncbi:MAG: hypothetical protein WBE99_04150 [Xanthobacteraceae bacterium]